MNNPNKTCPFCIENKLLRVNVLYEDELWYITDMEKGSINNAAMAMTKRHIETPFELNDMEWLELHNVIAKMKELVDVNEKPDGYNIGWNVYPAAGQNVSHAHLHLLARYDDEPLAGKGIRHAFKQADNLRGTNRE